MTPAELKAEIESGPLSASLAAHWSNVFPVEPQPPEEGLSLDRWNRISYRFGRLTPDAVFGLLQTLNDPTLRTCPQLMTIAAFTRFLAGRGLLRAIKTAASTPGPIGDICDLIVTITASAPESTIDPCDIGIIGMVDALVASGIATSDDKTALLAACDKPCSRLFELKTVVTEAELHAAKEIGS